MIKDMMKKVRVFSVLVAVGWMPASHAITELGQAVLDLGGDQLLVRAADAVYVTCVGQS